MTPTLSNKTSDKNPNVKNAGPENSHPESQWQKILLQCKVQLFLFKVQLNLGKGVVATVLQHPLWILKFYFWCWNFLTISSLNKTMLDNYYTEKTSWYTSARIAAKQVVKTPIKTAEKLLSARHHCYLEIFKKSKPECLTPDANTMPKFNWCLVHNQR